MLPSEEEEEPEEEEERQRDGGIDTTDANSFAKKPGRGHCSALRKAELLYRAQEMSWNCRAKCQRDIGNIRSEELLRGCVGTCTTG